MCGIPYHAATGYINKIIQAGYKVAICEQMEDPASVKGIVKREVVRIITPGTVLEENALIDGENNYLACLSYKDSQLGLSYCDISTGSFMATEVNGTTHLSLILDELARINPSEIVMDMDSVDDRTRQNIEHMGFFITALKNAYQDGYRKKVENLSDTERTLWDHKSSYKAAAILLYYLEDTQKMLADNFTSLCLYSLEDSLQMDMGTRRNLEITQSIREGDKRTSLVYVLDHTKTSMGARRLREMLQRPLLSLEKIQERQEYVAHLIEDVYLRRDLAKGLKKIYDLERIMTRVAYERAHARDLKAMQSSLMEAQNIKSRLLEADALFQVYGENLDVLDGLCQLLDTAIQDDPSVALKEGGIIATGYHEEVDQWRIISQEAASILASMESQERLKTGIKTLKIGYNRVFGYYIDVTKAQLDKVPKEYIRKQTLANSERYVTQELKEWEEKILSAKDKLYALEYELFVEIRLRVKEKTREIQALARDLSQLDVFVSFAEVAVARGYVRPELTTDVSVDIVDGRHPVVETILPNQDFIPNDCLLYPERETLVIITGPNMAGKSTYIRMVAVLAIMAQAGSFVPAKAMRMGIVDKIFARVGASDDLARGDSTFMVEMKEVSQILKHASSRSLVILDEVGRGTSTVDGLSIAWAIAEYIHDRIQARTLFATHYHELIALEGIYEGITNWSMAVEERKEDVLFLRKVIAGGTDQSYGIHVAQMAGLPRAVIDRANDKLKELLQSEQRLIFQQGEQMSFPKTNAALELLSEIDPESLSPKQALDLLFELKERSRN